MVRAQFQCTEVANIESGQRIKMNVDYNKCKEFTPYTPSGQMEFYIDKSASAINTIWSRKSVQCRLYANWLILISIKREE